MEHAMLIVSPLRRSVHLTRPMLKDIAIDDPLISFKDNEESENPDLLMYLNFTAMQIYISKIVNCYAVHC